MNTDELQVMLEALPDPLPHFPTFLEIAGYPHYENVCSNILKFYFNPNANHGFRDLLIKTFLQTLNYSDIVIPPFNEIEVKREVTTSNGRIDILIIAPEWIIAIENKIYHVLINDLIEYSDFLDKKFKGRKIIKVVLSLKEELENLSGGFVNVTYKDFLPQVDRGLFGMGISRDTPYKIYFQHFMTTITNLYKPVNMEKHEIDFLINNQDKISNLLALNQKLSLYINQRAQKIKNSINNLDPLVSKDVYAGYDIVFMLKTNDIDSSYKLECTIGINGITITICDEKNRVKKEKLERLAYFKKNQIENYRMLEDFSRLLIEENIDFYIDDNELINKLKAILALYKISE